MNSANILIIVKGRPYLTVALSLAALLTVWYLLSFLFGQYQLSAVSYGRLDDAPDSWSEQNRFILDDNLLSSVTPKLKQVLVNAPYVEARVQKCSCVLLNHFELEQINKMLASTETGKRLIAEGWNDNIRRGVLLYPSFRLPGLYGYDGVAYQVSVSYAQLAFPFYPDEEFGWFVILWKGFFFSVAACSATVVGQTILGLKRKEFAGGKVDAAYLICIVGIVAFIVAIWYFLIYSIVA